MSESIVFSHTHLRQSREMSFSGGLGEIHVTCIDVIRRTFLASNTYFNAAGVVIFQYLHIKHHSVARTCQHFGAIGSLARPQHCPVSRGAEA